MHIRGLWFTRFGTALAFVLGLGAQEPTRTEEIQKQRAEKAANLEPDQINRVEKALRTVRERKYLERFSAGYHGLTLKLGNMVTGSGFAFGPQYFRNGLFGGTTDFQSSAQISTRGYQNLQSSLTLPRLAGGKVTAEVRGSHRNYGSLQYYGTGPDT